MQDSELKEDKLSPTFLGKSERCVLPPTQGSVFKVDRLSPTLSGKSESLVFSCTSVEKVAGLLSASVTRLLSDVPDAMCNSWTSVCSNVFGSVSSCSDLAFCLRSLSTYVIVTPLSSLTTLETSFGSVSSAPKI